MKRPTSTSPCLAALALVCCGAAHAESIDLQAAIDRALSTEATYRAALAERRAVGEEIPRARAALLPQLSASGIRTDNRADIRQSGTLGRDTHSDYVSETYTLTLRQPILSREAWLRYRQADDRVAYAEQQLVQERERLIMRVAESYLNCLLADAAQELARVEIEALKGLATAAEKGLKAGTGTKTDLLDAEARLDGAYVKQIEARHELNQARRQLETLIGGAVSELYPIDGKRLESSVLAQEVEKWRETAVESNAEVATARIAVELAKREISLQQAGHFPTLDFIAQRQKTESDSITTIGSRYYTNRWGFQVNVPLFSGGLVSASSKQAAERLVRAQAEYDAAVEKISLQTARALETIEAASRRVKALARSEMSALASLEGTEKGLLAGTRTYVDVLNARQQLFEVRQARQRANVDYVYGFIDLNVVSGRFDESVKAEANGLLVMDRTVRLD